MYTDPWNGDYISFLMISVIDNRVMPLETSVVH